jgi:nucleotide-binding universal stress UspA family protein
MCKTLVDSSMPGGRLLNSHVPDDTVVVAQDGSAAALAAASIAIQIAQSQDLSVHGLYVVDETLALDSYADYRRELENSGTPSSRAELLTWFEKQGDAALQMLEIRCQAAGVPVTAELLAGGVTEMVLRESEGARLLAIGRRGHGHEADPDHLGQSFRTIAHHAHVPLAIGGDEERTVRRLLLAYDGSERTQPALTLASLLQRKLPADVTVVAVQENGRQPASEWLEDAEARLAGCQCLHRLGQPASEIVAVAEETQADLIVMGRYRHTAALEWLMGSTVDRVLRGTQLPVLMA